MQTFRKGLRLLELFMRRPEGLSPGELQEASGMSRRTLYLYLGVMEEEGFVARDPGTGRYVAAYPHPGFPLPAESLHDMAFYQGLAQEAFARTGHRAYVVTVRRFGLHLEATAGKPGQPLRLDPEGRGAVSAHAHASSAGLAILAHLPPSALWAHLARFPLRPFTKRTVTRLPELEVRLGEVRRLGFARSRGELSPRRCGLAVPLRLPSGHLLGALSIGLPLGSPCGFEVPSEPRACRACQKHLPALKALGEELWRSSET